MLSIQTNIASLYGQQNLSVNSNFQQTTINRLTSGYRINSAADDPAGMAVANALRNERTELSQGIRNGNDGVSQLQIIDGGLQNISQILDRLRTLAVQGASGTFTGDYGTLTAEIQKRFGRNRPSGRQHRVGREFHILRTNAIGLYRRRFGNQQRRADRLRQRDDRPVRLPQSAQPALDWTPTWALWTARAPLPNSKLSLRTSLRPSSALARRREQSAPALTSSTSPSASRSRR